MKSMLFSIKATLTAKAAKPNQGQMKKREVVKLGNTQEARTCL